MYSVDSASGVTPSSQMSSATLQALQAAGTDGWRGIGGSHNYDEYVQGGVSTGPLTGEFADAMWQKWKDFGATDEAATMLTANWVDLANQYLNNGGDTVEGMQSIMDASTSNPMSLIKQAIHMGGTMEDHHPQSYDVGNGRMTDPHDMWNAIKDAATNNGLPDRLFDTYGWDRSKFEAHKDEALELGNGLNQFIHGSWGGGGDGGVAKDGVRFDATNIWERLQNGKQLVQNGTMPYAQRNIA